MKKIFLLLMSSFLLIGCAATSAKDNTLKSVKVAVPAVEALPVTADLTVSEQRVSGEAEGTVLQRGMLQREAIAKALGHNTPSPERPDVLVGINVFEEVAVNKLKLTVTGYPAYYTNFRTAKEEEKPLEMVKASPMPYSKPKQEQQQEPDLSSGGFTTSQRVGTWALNTMLPGVGSIGIMGDVAGAVPQWILTATAITMFVLYEESSYEETIYRQGSCASYNYTYGYCNYYYTYYDYEYHEDEEFLVMGIVALGTNAIWNIIRSATYGKNTQSVASIGNGIGDFNVAVLPNQKGRLNTFLMYNKTF